RGIHDPMPPSSATGEGEDDWRPWLARGRHAAAVLDFATAERAYRLAIAKASRAGSATGEALARAEQAYVVKELSQPRAAWTETDAVLSLLAMTDIPPELPHTHRAIARRFRDHAALEAYAK